MLMTLVLLALCTAVFVLVRYLTEAGIRKLGTKNQVSEFGLAFVLRATNTVLFIVYGLVILGLLGLDLSDVEVLLSSIFAVAGVAFFAQWSILSNITASAIIFFSFPYRVGDWIQVVEKDVDIQGTVEDISLFHVLIRNNRGELVTYPNSLILQKPVLRMTSKPTMQLPENLVDDLVPFGVGELILVRDSQGELQGHIAHKNPQRLLLTLLDGSQCAIPAARLGQCLLMRSAGADASPQQEKLDW
ncbi:mechanosensitive ion channel domain-containing protein [Simiduia agarivorans]|uniref:Small-conductance mechanosensitive channel n=1 Tax=Simiduia agarivorans (strain DSM 21679 / JCM 13881 / BCRC 17597 / SA1) TaxID=1117647 RepID=K4KQQ3_SIMAS|nr:mechanosensitive ion channel domain-containing protein [Simiduia agarivorans]AFV00596.1 hypothetical protein M5M_17335 [Simiduia agarivorans SA1 = DSM 21679]